MRVSRRVLPLLVLAASLQALWPVARGGAQTTEADVHVAQAIIAIDERRYDAALAELKRALEIEPDHVEALYYTGVVYAAQRRPDLAVPFLEKARAKAPADPAVGFQLGLAYFARQQYDRAQPLLEAVFKTNPELDGLGYYVGFLRYRAKDYRGALAAFRAGRASDPEIQQLTRFSSGLALAVLGLPTQAAAEVEQALRLAPGSAVTGPAERLRDTIVAARATERRLSLDARLGFFYDDNVRVVPSANGREPLVADLRRPRHTSTGELFAVRADYVWWRTEDWESSLGYSFFTTYNNDVPRFSVLDHLVSAGLVRKLSLGSRPAQLGLQYSYEWLGLDADEFLTRHTIALSGAVVESEHHLTQAFARFQNKDFDEGVPPPPRQAHPGYRPRRAAGPAAARNLPARRGGPRDERGVEHGGVRLRPPRLLARPLLGVLNPGVLKHPRSVDANRQPAAATASYDGELPDTARQEGDVHPHRRGRQRQRIHDERRPHGGQGVGKRRDRGAERLVFGARLTRANRLRPGLEPRQRLLSNVGRHRPGRRWLGARRTEERVR